MSCSPFDLKDYFLQELPDPQQRQVEAHVKKCEACGEELDRLRIMGAALRSVAEEEIPQRIAFVSDKIFEPSPWRRRLAAFWNSGSRLGFVSAAMLSASLMVFALRPAPAPVTLVREVAATAPASSTQAANVTPVAAPVSEAEIQQRIQAAVDRAVEVKTADMAKKLDTAERTLLQAAETFDYNKRKMSGVMTAALGYGLPEADRKLIEVGK